MQNRQQDLSRGQLARLTGVNGEPIRYYENINLLPRPPRSSGGHRIYDRAQLSRLFFIKRCRELGFALQEIRELLELVDGGNYTCAEICDRTTTHLEDIETRIRDLRNMRRVLQTMVEKCDGGSVPECPLIAELFHL